jgi:hypothetical protein
MFSGKDISVKISEKSYFQADGEVIEGVYEMHVVKAERREFTAFNKPLIKSLFADKI